MKNPFNFPYTKCPYCGSGTITIRQRIFGESEYYIDLETGEIDSTEMHLGLTYKNKTKYAYCTDCRKRLFKLEGSGVV